jgi:hypothetical protein
MDGDVRGVDALGALIHINPAITNWEIMLTSNAHCLAVQKQRKVVTTRPSSERAILDEPISQEIISIVHLLHKMLIVFSFVLIILVRFDDLGNIHNQRRGCG